ncbi:MAG TPA: glycosyltransferase [Bacteroidales bacterium]|nr:glycosyltransferase [Bacteroidales bacterium]
MKKVAIILASYNQEQYISEAIESIMMQRFDGEISVIVADDASTDTTLDIIRSFEANSPFRFVYLPKEANLGIFKNYKRAFAACDGDYVAVMEGDDYWVDPYRIQKHVDFLDKHRECVMSMNRMIVYYESQSRFSHQKWTFKEDYQYINAQMMAYGNLLGNLSACVFRKSEIDKLKPEIFDINTADWMLGLALGQYGFIAKLKDLMSVYRVSPNGTWSKKTKKEVTRSLLETITRYDKFLSYRYTKEFSALRLRVKLEKFAPKFVGKIIQRLMFPFIKRKLRS